MLNPNLSFHEVESLARKAETNWLKIKLPAEIKAEFASVWDASIGYPAIPSDGQIKLYTSDTNCENVVDSDLAKAIAAGNYRAHLHALRDAIKELAGQNNILTFKDDFKAKVNGQPASWDLWKGAIEGSQYSEEEQSLLKLFLTNADAFHGIKGISREDFAAPAICNAIAKRIDRFGIADQIAMATTEGLSDKVKIFIENKSIAVTEFTRATLPKNLHTSPLVQSLLTKPFTILTGASGTGKTKLAESLASHFRNREDTNIAIVPVGADWTDNRNVLGFVNHLRDTGPDGAKLPIYQSTPVLDLLLEASKEANKDTPHFLILDEMNLSHVERYFADFLSAMEQGNGTLPLHSEGPRENEKFTLPRFDGDDGGVPRSINYPNNLYVIGTVNIDETTYMFSPKVLDRANVIEFKVEHNEIEKFLKEAGNYPRIEKADDGQAEAFHALGMQAREGTLTSLPKRDGEGDKKIHDHVQQHMLDLFDIMQAGRFEFAYRTAKEVMRYMCVCRFLTGDETAQSVWDKAEDEEDDMGNTIKTGWKSDLDDQVLQKILPKLHGSIGRVGKLLASLADYCHQGKAVDGDKGLKAILELDPKTAEFKKSFAKLQSMIRTLLDEQFVSFIQ